LFDLYEDENRIEDDAEYEGGDEDEWEKMVKYEDDGGYEERKWE